MVEGNLKTFFLHGSRECEQKLRNSFHMVEGNVKRNEEIPFTWLKGMWKETEELKKFLVHGWKEI